MRITSQTLIPQWNLVQQVDDHHMHSVAMDATHGHNHEDIHGAGAVVVNPADPPVSPSANVPPPEQQPISQKEKKKIKKKK